MCVPTRRSCHQFGRHVGFGMREEGHYAFVIEKMRAVVVGLEYFPSF